jgi:biotin carboxylase
LCSGKREFHYLILNFAAPLSWVVCSSNQGIAAVKAIRSMRRWAYETFGSDRVLQFVVMATPDDLQADAEFIRLADQFVPVPGLSVDAIDCCNHCPLCCLSDRMHHFV